MVFFFGGVGVVGKERRGERGIELRMGGREGTVGVG